MASLWRSPRKSSLVGILFTEGNVPTLGQGKLTKHIKALVYSRSGLGKTFGAGTWPRPNFIDCDRGIKVLANPEFIKLHGFKKDLLYEQFVERNLNARGVPTQHNAFDDVCRYFDACMKAQPNEWRSHDGTKTTVGRDLFDTWVVDTGTSLSAYALFKSIVLLGGTFKGVSSGTLDEALKHGLIFPKIQDYGSERSLVEQFIAMLYDTEKNVLFLCHEKEMTDKGGDLTGIVPLLTGKGVEAISLMFDDVWNLRVRKQGPETIRYLQTRTDGLRSAKSRAGYPDGMLWDYAVIAKEHEKLLNLQKEQGK